jgi:hypothetical protein
MDVHSSSAAERFSVMCNWKRRRILIGRRVRRLAEESCQFQNRADVVVLGLRREMADAHVLDHAPAKWRDAFLGHAILLSEARLLTPRSSDRTLPPVTALPTMTPTSRREVRYRASGLVLWWSRSVARVALGRTYLLPPLSSDGAARGRPLLPVSTPRSSNRTCRSPASGSRPRSHAFTHEGPRPSWVRRTSRKCPYRCESG